MVTISVVAITRPTFLETERLATVADQESQPTRGLASIRARTSNHKKMIEQRMKSEAEKEFNQMLSDWRKERK